jgi:hypothetical protein
VVGDDDETTTARLPPLSQSANKCGIIMENSDIQPDLDQARTESSLCLFPPSVILHYCQRSPRIIIILVNNTMMQLLDGANRVRRATNDSILSNVKMVTTYSKTFSIGEAFVIIKMIPSDVQQSTYDIPP